MKFEMNMNTVTSLISKKRYNEKTWRHTQNMYKWIVNKKKTRIVSYSCIFVWKVSVVMEIVVCVVFFSCRFKFFFVHCSRWETIKPIVIFFFVLFNFFVCFLPWPVQKKINKNDHHHCQSTILKIWRENKKLKYNFISIIHLVRFLFKQSCENLISLTSSLSIILNKKNFSEFNVSLPSQFSCQWNIICYSYYIL